MERVCVDGCWVPAALAGAFRSRENTPFREKTPFSYSEPNPGGPELHRRICMPRVLPFVKDEMSAQPVHLQYNSPMGLYSKEAAEEQYQQQIGSTTPIPLPTGDKHFDPSKSATLKYIKEGDNSNFGANFAEKIAAAEAPRHFEKEEPHWARYAREKSERARSRTPADPHIQYHQEQSHVAPLSHPGHYEEVRDHAEKSKTFTHTTQHPYGPAYYEMQQPRRRQGYSEPREFPHRGYEYGGTDYTQGLPIQKGPADPYYVPPRKEEQRRFRPGYELGGTDFGQGYVAPGPYHGHGPDPPRLRSRYTADSRSPCNVYVAPNVDRVNANLLVGDTLSNQKIKHEVRHIDQSEFGTSFAPPGGFKRDHVTVHRTPPPPEPVTFSLSAKKRSASAGPLASSAPSHHRDVYWSRQQEDLKQQFPHQPQPQVNPQTLLSGEALEKKYEPEQPRWREKSVEKQEAWRNRSDPRLHRLEVYQTEPNWSRTVQQRRGAWERRAFDTEARVNLPPSAKVAPDAPPAWHRNAERTHQVWQNAADNMNQNSYNQSYQTQTYSTQESAPPPQQNYYQTQQQSYQTQSNGTNAGNVINTGFNQNQVDYVMSHRDKYGAGQKYAPPTAGTFQTQYTYNNGPSGGSTYQSSYQHSSSERTHPIALGGPTGHSQSGYQQSHFEKSEETRSTTPIAVQRPSSQQSSYQQSYHKTTSETTSQAPIALPPPQSNYQESSYRKEVKSSETTQNLPVVQPALSRMEESSYRKETSSETTRTIPVVQPVQSRMEESSYRKEMSSSETTTAAPVVQPVQSRMEESSYRKEASSSETTRTVPVVQPVQSRMEESRYRKETSSETTTTVPVVQPVQSSIEERSYRKQTSSSETTHTIPVQPKPIQNLMEESSFHRETRSSSSTERFIPVQPIQTSLQESTFRKEMSTSQTNLAPVQTNKFESFHNEIRSNSSERTIPIRPISTNMQESSFRKESSSLNTTLAPIQSETFESKFNQEVRSTSSERIIPVQPVETSFKDPTIFHIDPKTECQLPQKNRVYRSEIFIPVNQHHQPPSKYQESSSYRREESSTTGSQPAPASQFQNRFDDFNRSQFNQQQTFTAPSGGNYSTHFESSYSTQNAPQMMHSPAGSYKSYSSSHYSKQEKTTTTSGGAPVTTFPAAQVTTTLPITKKESYSYSSSTVPSQPQPVSIQNDSFTSHKVTQPLQSSQQYQGNYSSSQSQSQVTSTPIVAPASRQEESYRRSYHSEKREETESRPVSQLSQYSESRNYSKRSEEKTETTTVPAYSNVQTTKKDISNATNINDVFNKHAEMNETLPRGTLSNTQNNTEGGYRDKEGHDVSYKRELTTAVDPNREQALLKEEERRVVETPMEPGVISRHVTTKYYKKKTVTDSTTTTQPTDQQQ